MSTFGDFMIADAVKKNQEIILLAQQRDALAQRVKQLEKCLSEGATRMADLLMEHLEAGEENRPFIAACSDWQVKAITLAKGGNR